MMNTKVGLERLSSSSSDLTYLRFGIHIHRGPSLRPDRRGRRYYIFTVGHLNLRSFTVLIGMLDMVK
jgi:hypothetical protein